MKLLLVALEMGMAGIFFNKDEGSEVTQQRQMIKLCFHNGWQHNTVLQFPHNDFALCMFRIKYIQLPLRLPLLLALTITSFYT